MTKEDKLVLLIEEAGEIIQAATKCIRFTWDRDKPGYGINHEVLAKEIGDLLGIIDSLPLNNNLIEKYRKDKMDRVLKNEQWRKHDILE